ncbi:unnamed protein product [Paramecium pentaurelia]|uniref:Uncharacterized protein n=1 Tax=Paramecium pentaurelia TaxID=43138 RepID=A0A8S1T5T3_9CILI|nr:unnamed protein product [Paramecium pentaurelia]
MSQLTESPNRLNEQQSIPHDEIIDKSQKLATSSPDKENSQELFRLQKQQFLQKMTQDNSTRRQKKIIGDIKDVVNVNKQIVNFGLVIPGNICEDDIQFQNLSNETVIIGIQVICNNTEFDDLDEYVYSARKLNGYDYNDRFMLACPAQKQFSMKIALKVPNIKEQKGLFGTIIITASYSNHSKIQGQINTQIQSQITLPSIECPKTLMNSAYNLPVIQMAFKLGKKLDCKIPFRNNSLIGLPLEMEFLNKNDNEILINPPTLSVQGNSQFLVTIYIKSKQEQIIKNVLIVKVKNSNVHFSYPFIIKIY